MKFITIVNGQKKLVEESSLIQILKIASPGDFKFHFTHYTGALSIIEMQQLGWAILNGTTAESQLVTPGYFQLGDLAITGNLDNLITHNFSGRVKSLFVRSGLNSGEIKEDTFQRHYHKQSLQDVGLVNTGEGGDSVGGGNFKYSNLEILEPTTDGISGEPRTGLETMPAHTTAIPLMYCLKN
jgi:hypothetical protein